MAELTRSSVLSAVALCALAVTGCSADEDGNTRALETLDCPDDAADAGDAGTPDGTTPALDGGIDSGTPDAAVESPTDASEDTGATSPSPIPSPSGTYYASISANGTGCPAGTVNTSISPDGNDFRIELSAYEVNVTSTTPEPQISKNCSLAFKFHSPNGISFAVKSFAYEGYAFLEEGVQLSQWARYYFAGSPVPPVNSNRVVRTGPYDGDFMFKDEVDPSDMIWSPCGSDRDLNVYTQMQIRNSVPKREGYAHVQQIASIELAFRSCDGTPIPVPIVANAGVRLR